MLAYIMAMLLSVSICWIVSHEKIPCLKKVPPKIQLLIRVVLIGLPLFVISAFRYNIGTDYGNYLTILARTRLSEIEKYYGPRKIEPLYMLLNNIIIALDADPQWLFIVTSAVYTMCVVYVIVKLSPNPCMSLFLLFGTTAFFEQMNAMRGHMAYAILLMALVCLFEKKNIRFFLLCIVAGLIHYSAFIFVFVFVLAKKKIPPKVLLVFIVLCFAGKNIIEKLLYVVINQTPYAMYLNRLDMTGSSMWGLLIQTVIVLFMTVFYDKENRNYNTLYAMAAVSLMISIFMNSIPLIGRMRWIFFYPVALLGIPAALKNCKWGAIKNTVVKKIPIRAIMTVGMIVGFTVYAYILVVVNKGYGVYPYQWIF